MVKSTSDQSSMSGGVVPMREYLARLAPENQTSFDVFKDFSDNESLAALALLACGRSVSRSEGREGSRSWDSLLGSGGEPINGCLPTLAPLLMDNSTANTRSGSESTNRGGGGGRSRRGGKTSHGEGSANGLPQCVGNDPGPMPRHSPFERRTYASNANHGSVRGSNGQRHHPTAPGSWDLSVSQMSSALHDGATRVRGDGHSRGQDCEQPSWNHPDTPVSIPGAGGNGGEGCGVSPRRMSADNHPKPTYRCPSFDPHQEIDLPFVESSWPGTPTDPCPLSANTVLVEGNRPAGGSEAGVATDGGGGGNEVAAPSYTRSRPPNSTSTNTNTVARSPEATAPPSVSGGSAVSPWGSRPDEDNGPKGPKQSFDALKSMIPGLDSFTGGGRGSAVKNGGMRAGNTPPPERTDVLQARGGVSMLGDDSSMVATTSPTIPSLPVRPGSPREGALLGAMGSVKRPFPGDVERQDGQTALSMAGDMLTPRQVCAGLVLVRSLVPRVLI